MDCVEVVSLAGRPRQICDGKIMPLTDKQEKASIITLAELDQQIGHGKGDIIKVLAAPVAKAIGKHGCTPCETRRVIVNAFNKLKRKHGSLRATSMMAELMTLTVRNPDDAVSRLNEYLNG